MKLVEKFTIVSELVPQGYESWTQYYERKSTFSRLCDYVIPPLAVLTLLTAYVLVSIVEAM